MTVRDRTVALSFALRVAMQQADPRDRRRIRGLFDGVGVTTTTVDIQPDVAAASPVEMASETTILITEDDPLQASLLAGFLKHESYRVIIAESGMQSLAAAAHEHPHLILLDAQLPDLDGFEVCERLKQDPKLMDIPVIFLTGMTNPKDKERGFRCGGVDYIAKPVSRGELAARVRTHLELAQNRRQLRLQAELLEGVVANQSGRLDQVRTGQEGLLINPASLEGITAAVRFMPAMEAGGDFYDAIRLADGHYGFFVADVSGHDLSVAYLTGALKALTASFTSDSLTVHDTMIMMNSALKKFLELGRYATASYVTFSRQTMTLEVICAGHPAPLFHAKTDRPRYIETLGDVLGVYDTITCDVRSVSVAPGDRLFMYTDGLIEGVPTPTGQTGDRRFGSEWLRRKVSAYRDGPLQQTVSQVISELAQARNGQLDDDVLLMGVEF